MNVHSSTPFTVHQNHSSYFVGLEAEFRLVARWTVLAVVLEQAMLIGRDCHPCVKCFLGPNPQPPQLGGRTPEAMATRRPLETPCPAHDAAGPVGNACLYVLIRILHIQRSGRVVEYSEGDRLAQDSNYLLLPKLLNG